MKGWRGILIGLALLMLAGFALALGGACDRASEGSLLAGDRVLLIILDGTNEAVFARMLHAGKLPHFAKLLEPGKDGRSRGVYTAATGVWPSTTGPAYEPFLAGIFPEKSDLSGIRQYLRDQMAFRAYIGWETNAISEELSREFPIIYEVLGPEDTFNQQGFVTRRGWRDDGRVIRPLHENYISVPGAIARYGLGHVPQNDLQNTLSFLNYTTPWFDREKFLALGAYEGSYFSWGAAAQARALAEALVGLAGFERVARRKDLGAWRLGYLPRFSMISLHLPDDTSHNDGMGEVYEKALGKVDEIFGALWAVYDRAGALDDVTVIVSADHGTSPVGEDEAVHFDLIAELTRDTGVPIHDSIRRMSDDFNETWRAGEHRRWAGIAAVSGNANVQIYLRKPGAALDDWRARPGYADLAAYTAGVEGAPEAAPVDLVETLRRYEAVSHVYAADRENAAYHVFTAEGEGAIRVRPGPAGQRAYAYAVVAGPDPLGYTGFELTAPMIGKGAFYDGDVWAAATRETNFPDGIVQIVQLLEGKNTGDIVIDAAPGFEPWTQMQRGLHGALRREHIAVPLLIHGPRLNVAKAKYVFAQGRLPRTVDIYPTLLALLDVTPPGRIRWEVPRLGGFLGSEAREAAVRTDIDGEELDIWMNK
ncbi:MAG: alkaline phosphatase family protein [Deltaproteobacteria bacterium]|nr:alkaline phosphatase family protein [Deltaproteobacteria bacterium]